MNTNARALLQVLPFFSPPVPRVSEPFGERVVVDFQLRNLLLKKERKKYVGKKKKNAIKKVVHTFSWRIK